MVQQIAVNGEQIIPGRSGALVASKSQPGWWHCVKVVDGAHVCDCRGFHHRGTCRHVATVRALAGQPLRPTTPNPTVALAEQTLAGAFDAGPKRRENLHAADVTAGEDVSYAEWHERHAS